MSRRCANSASVASGASMRARATRWSDTAELRQRVAVGQGRDGDRLAVRGAHRSRQVGLLGVEHPVEVAVELPGHQSRLQLQDARRGTHPAEQREHSLDALPGHHSATPSDAPGRGRTDEGDAFDQLGGVLRGDHQLHVHAALGEAQRAACQEAASQPRHPAMIGARGPCEPGRVGILETDRQASHGRRSRATLGRITQAGTCRGPAAGARGFDGRELGTERLDQVAVRSLCATTGCCRHGPARQAVRTATGTCWACRSSRIRSSATASFWGSWRWALSTSTTSAVTSWGVPCPSIMSSRTGAAG